MDRAYEGIIDVIKERTERKGNGINYYEAARIAYTISPSGVETEVTEVNQFSIYINPVLQFFGPLHKRRKKSVVAALICSASEEYYFSSYWIVGKLKLNVAPPPSELFSAHILPP
jgi:hypothetical protein